MKLHKNAQLVVPFLRLLVVNNFLNNVYFTLLSDREMSVRSPEVTGIRQLCVELVA